MPKEKGAKLDLDDRIIIASGIDNRESLASIARRLGVHRSTVSREIRANRTDKGLVGGWSHCAYRPQCTVKRVCKDKNCTRSCSACRRFNCASFCTNYQEIACPLIKRAPYVCNRCGKRTKCAHRRYIYRAKEADQMSINRKKLSRCGINLVKAKADPIIDQIVTRLSRGQSPAHIWHAMGA